MFTGLIEEIGRVYRVDRYGEGVRLTIQAPQLASSLMLGESIAVDGVCLTVVQCEKDHFTVEAVAETLRRTTLSDLKPGDQVNLERALQPQSRLGGHFVQGHVDGVGHIISIRAHQPGFWFEISLEPELLPYVVEKGSIAIDGISLTVAEVNNQGIAVAVIPFTASHTTLGSKKVGDAVNIEVDILCKYVHRLLNKNSNRGDLTEEQMRGWGY